MTVNRILFSHAKIFEYEIQGFLTFYSVLPCDGGEVVNDKLEVLCQQIG